MTRAQYGVFRYLAAAEHSETYRRIMLQFVAAKERFTVHLRPEEIQDALGERRDFTAALAQLVEWGNLRADPDTSRVATVEEFNRVRFIYQLSAEGESAERALGEFDRTFGATGVCSPGRSTTSSISCGCRWRWRMGPSSTRRRLRSRSRP